MEKKHRHYVIGTAGHIDHGKTSLVKNLTGTDTDRLKEEIERGMTIDIGFAFLTDDITIIDVPGHEKFVRNMVAGVSTIDLVLLVIAADDGVMPQTREHLEILNLLQIRHGIIVLSKIDLIQGDWADLVVEDIRASIQGTFLETAPIVRISNVTGQGIEELKGIIFDTLSRVAERKDRGVFRLPIDRIFTMKGFGTVAAGTVISGAIQADQMIELLPQQKKLRIRGIQMHEKKVDEVRIGDRAAVNLLGIDKESIRRGDILATPDLFRPTRFFDARLYALRSNSKKLKNTSRVRIHLGTAEVIGRMHILDADEVNPGDHALVQFHLETPVIADFDDRFVLRSYSPVYTIGGGRVLDAHPRRHKRLSPEIIENLRKLEAGDPAAMVEDFMLRKSFGTYTYSSLSHMLSMSVDDLTPIITRLLTDKKLIAIEEKGQKLLIHDYFFQQAGQKITDALHAYHLKFPTRKGVSRTDLKVLMGIALEPIVINKLIDALVEQGSIAIHDKKIALAGYQQKIPDGLRDAMERISALYLREKFTTSSPSALAEMLHISQSQVQEAIDVLLEENVLINVDTGMIIHAEMMEQAKKSLDIYFAHHDTLTVSECTKLLDTSRKYSVPILIHLDGTGFTVRQGDVRIKRQ